MSESQQELELLVSQKYRHGFVTDIESDTVPPGLDEEVIRKIYKAVAKKPPLPVPVSPYLAAV